MKYGPAVCSYRPLSDAAPQHIFQECVVSYDFSRHLFEHRRRMAEKRREDYHVALHAALVYLGYIAASHPPALANYRSLFQL